MGDSGKGWLLQKKNNKQTKQDKQDIRSLNKIHEKMKQIAPDDSRFLHFGKLAPVLQSYRLRAFLL